MDVTVETAAQTSGRLARVLAAADVVWLAEDYGFRETEAVAAMGPLLAEALAVVRDGAAWSVLEKADAETTERFCIFSCHFAPDIPNSGFVGWLASEFKKNLGTGVFVVCGQNSRRGGIFDYWGLPLEMRDEARALLDRLRNAAG